MIKTGKNCNIHPSVVIFGEDNIEIGDNVRIDAFCVLSGGSGLKIGSHIHIACGCYFFAGAGIFIEDFVQIGARSTLLSQSDDFSGDSLIGPCVPMKFKPKFKSGQIILEKHVVFGVNCTVVPGITLHEGAAVGINSYVNKNCEPWTLYAGSPIKKIRERNKKMLELEREFLKEYNG